MSADPGFWKHRRVFITGHTGFKGSWLVSWLTGLGAAVGGYALAPNTDPNIFGILDLGARCDHVLGDIRDVDALFAAMSAFKPDVAIHMAAQPLVRLSYEQPSDTFAVNVQGTVNFLEACRRQETLKSVVVVTTDKCYVNREWAWSYRETDPLGGRDPYSASKACAEIVTGSYRDSFFAGASAGAPVSSARAGNVFGGGDWSLDRLVPDIVRSFVRQAPVEIRSPRAVRPWQHVLEPLAGYLMLARGCFEYGREFAEGWNFGPSDGQMLTVQDFVNMMSERWGGPGSNVVTPPNTPHEAQLLLLDSGLARRRLGWHPQMSMAQSINSTVDWYRAFYDGASASEMQRITTGQIGSYAGALGWAAPV
ncbi:CDP-glucose 4,6-dehydratase [Tardiphaga sp. vice278]|uniref:CDP-glucose 4,6-dehydratase n=1 Tax=Tardiphaga sp. vice278 TaxID=2592815 RepID=UPI001FEDDE75|nr:CDP-glucose 4,6-dehydratase [Tardiphaga sp. vice278]